VKRGLCGGLEGSVVVEGSEQLYKQVEARGERRREEEEKGGVGKRREKANRATIQEKGIVSRNHEQYLQENRTLISQTCES